ncbi:MAG: hypothetical protein VKK04_10200 [Synechococcales bacterium]|nr:hypothetical protein [Synechococcales bacterium]
MAPQPAIAKQTQNFVGLIHVGPKQTHLADAMEALDSLFHYEPGIKGMVAINDAPDPHRLQGLEQRYGGKLTSVHCPWHSQWSDGIWGRGCSRNLLGMKRAYEHYQPFSYLLKLDTDALVIDSFSESISQFFEQHPEVGLIGTYQVTPQGEVRRAPKWSTRIAAYANGIGFKDLKKNHLSLLYFLTHRPVFRRMSDVIRTAIANGYEPSEHCQGGSYAVSFPLIQQLYQRGELDHPEQWLYMNMGEDFLLAIHTRYLGYQMADFNRAGEPFGIDYLGLPFPPAELVARGYAIVHSTNNDPLVSQETINAFFRDRRQQSVVG